MHIGLRFHDKEDADLIKDVERFTKNRKFTRTERIKFLMRLGKQAEANVARILEHVPTTPQVAAKRPYPTKTLPLGPVPVEVISVQEEPEEIDFENLIASTSFDVS